MRHLFFFVGVALLFSSCGGISKTETTDQQSFKSTVKEGAAQESKLRETITNSRKQSLSYEKSAMLSLELIEENESEVVIELQLKNPLKKEISAVRSFLAFNPDLLKGKSIELSADSPFHIVAPGENEFDQKNGFVKIGISASEGKVFREQSISLATIRFTRTGKSFTTIDFYGFGEDEKTVVLEKINDSTFRDILEQPDIPTLPLSPQL